MLITEIFLTMILVKVGAYEFGRIFCEGIINRMRVFIGSLENLSTEFSQNTEPLIDLLEDLDKEFADKKVSVLEIKRVFLDSQILGRQNYMPNV